MIDLSPYRGQTIAVMGLGKSGLATARALKHSGADVIAWDDQAVRREAAAKEGIRIADLVKEAWEGIAFLVLSPGIPHSFPAPHPVAKRARDAGCPILGDIELLARASSKARYVGITGTNGKSTTTSLIGHILTQTGRHAAVGGNLGTPALEFEPMSEDGFYVIEMSSYQLELTSPIPFDVAILLNISPDHLDRHGGMPGYIAAKKRIFDDQRTGQFAVIGMDDETCRSIFDMLCAARRQRVLPISGDHRVPGGHHHQISDDPIGDEGLGTVDNHFLGFFHCGSRHGSQIAARAGLGHGHSADKLSRHQAREVSLLDLLRAKGFDVRHDDIAVKIGRQTGMPGPGKFLGHDEGIQKIPAHPTVGGCRHGTQKSFLAHATPNLPGHNALLLPLVHVGCDFFRKKCSQAIAEAVMVFRKLEYFHFVPCSPYSGL